MTEYDIIENGSPADRCQVVRWLRHFPFAFITDREYVIARRLFREPSGCLYALTKSVQHPRACVDSSVVRMDVFYSMWRARTVPCPHGSGKPACETVLPAPTGPSPTPSAIPCDTLSKWHYLCELVNSVYGELN